MSVLPRARRLPLESEQPVLVFALCRVGLTLFALLGVVALGFPYEGLAAVLVAVALPWTLFTLALARLAPGAALNPLIAAGDILMLGIIELIVPETYGAIRFIALAFLAVHAHFQGEVRGVGVALGSTLALVLVTNLHGDGGPGLGADQLIFYDTVFVAAAVVTVALVGRFRTEESASRLQARGLSRRTIENETELLRRVSERLHDGPVQELIGLDMLLTAAGRAAAQGNGGEAEGLLGEAREIVERNIRALRDEMVELGPSAYEEMSYEMAVERSLEVWQRRFGITAVLDVERLDLPSAVEGELFGITQEAVTNAARHGGAETVWIGLHQRDGELELTLRDDGSGFDGVDPLGPTQPGHLGLASVRERVKLIGGSLGIESSPAGALLRVSAPLPRVH